MEQLSFASLDYQAKKKRTKREKFLAEMNGVIPWSRMLHKARTWQGEARRRGAPTHKKRSETTAKG